MGKVQKTLPGNHTLLLYKENKDIWGFCYIEVHLKKRMQFPLAAKKPTLRVVKAKKPLI